jgi:hypothetical protein
MPEGIWRLYFLPDIVFVALIVIVLVVFNWHLVKKLWCRFGVSTKAKAQIEDEDTAPKRDFLGWDALQYILNETAFGHGKEEHEVIAALRQAAADKRITVWASKPSQPHVIIPGKMFVEYTFSFEPGGSGGMIYKDSTWLAGGDVYYDPMFSRQEIEREFGNTD